MGCRDRENDQAENNHHPWIQWHPAGPFSPWASWWWTSYVIQNFSLFIDLRKEWMLIGYTILLFYWLNYPLTSNINQSTCSVFLSSWWVFWVGGLWVSVHDLPPAGLTFYPVGADFCTDAKLAFLVTHTLCILSLQYQWYILLPQLC